MFSKFRFARGQTSSDFPTHFVPGAGSVSAARPASQQARSGATPTPALQTRKPVGPKDLIVGPIAPSVARDLCERFHYLKSYPGGALLNFGVFVGQALRGVAVIGVGPFNIHRLFRHAEPHEVQCLSRLWIDDRCGRNSESRVLGIILRLLRRHQSQVKALVAYSDPEAGHIGTIYRAAGFAYLGRSYPMPLYQFPDGSVHHSRTLGHSFGTHSLRYFKAQGVDVHPVPQAAKFVYVALIDPTWRNRLTRPILPYSSLEVGHESRRHPHH